MEWWVAVSLWERMEKQRIWRWKMRGRRRKEKGSLKKRKKKKKLMTIFKIQQLLVNHTLVEILCISASNSPVQKLSVSFPPSGSH